MLWQAESQGKKPSLLAKLAKGLSECYRRTIDHFRTGLVRHGLCGVVAWRGVSCRFKSGRIVSYRFVTRGVSWCIVACRVAPGLPACARVHTLGCMCLCLGLCLCLHVCVYRS